jgi:hypothetical protein
MSEDTLAVLKSIDLSLRTLVVIAQKKAEAPIPAGETPRLVPNVASDRDLSGDYGDPIVKAKSPRDWTGEPMLGRKFSECPPEYLELVAERLDYFAERDEATNELASNGKPKAYYSRLDAARARGWAKRIREGKVPVQAAPAPTTWAEPPEDADVPFRSGR